MAASVKDAKEKCHLCGALRRTDEGEAPGALTSADLWQCRDCWRKQYAPRPSVRDKAPDETFVEWQKAEEEKWHRDEGRLSPASADQAPAATPALPPPSAPPAGPPDSVPTPGTMRPDAPSAGLPDNTPVPTTIRGAPAPHGEPDSKRPRLTTGDDVPTAPSAISATEPSGLLAAPSAPEASGVPAAPSALEPSGLPAAPSAPEPSGVPAAPSAPAAPEVSGVPAGPPAATPAGDDRHPEIVALHSIRRPAALEDHLPKLDPPGSKKEDNLTKIRGIGMFYELRLNKVGIWTFTQLASMTPEVAAEVGKAIHCSGRMESDQWVWQAERLADEKRAWIIHPPIATRSGACSRQKKQYERDLMDIAEHYGKDDKILGADHAECLWWHAMDGHKLTEREGSTLDYIMKHFKLNKEASTYLKTKLKETTRY